MTGTVRQRDSSETMTEDAAETVLERKAIAQRRALGVGTVSLPRALGRGLSIAADALWGLGLAVEASDDISLRAERVRDRMEDDALLILLENDAGPCGLAAFDRALVTGLIEVQTLGKVTRLPTDTRRYTPTDAAMMAPLLDAALPRFASMLAGQPEMAHLQGYRFGALVEDAQTAGLALDAARYHLTEFDVSLAQDTRRGRAHFLFPEPPEPAGDAPPPAAGKHQAVLRLVPARMQAVLTRVHLPLHKAQALKAGDVLPISSQAVTSATLVVQGGHIAARGKLGQINGFRAVRIGWDGSPFHQASTAKPAADPGPVDADPHRVPLATSLPVPAADLALDGQLEKALEDLTPDLPEPLGTGEP